MHLEKITLHPEKFPTRDHYPFNLEVLNRTPEIPLTAPLTFFIGENGTGKSTLLRAACTQCGVYIWEGPTRPRANPNPYERALNQALSVLWTNGKVPGSFFGSEIFENFSRLLDEWATSDPSLFEYFGGQSLMTQSHGQSLMAFFKSRYSRKGLYFLDEPETGLSPKSQLALARVLLENSRAGHAQFLVVTHSPILLACPGARIYSFDEAPIKTVEYKETDYYRIYKDFFSNPEKHFA